MMDSKSKLAGVGVWTVFAAVLVTGLGLALRFTTAGGGLTALSYDLPFVARPHPAPAEVVLVYMDEASHRALGQSLIGIWDRALHARLIERLTRAGAKAIVFDIAFTDPWPDPKVDEAFGRALREHGRVALAADPGADAFDERFVTNMRRLTMPTDVLRSAAATVGSAETKPDSDSVIRRHFHGDATDLVGSLTWNAARLLGAPVTKEEEQKFVPRWVNYYGESGTLPSISYLRALDTNAPLDDLIRDKVIFVGQRLFTLAQGRHKDEFRTPFSYWSPEKALTSGVEVQATLFLNLLRGDWLSRWSGWTEGLLIVVVGLVVALGLLRLPPWMATAAAGTGMAIIAAAACALFAWGRVWFPWLIPVAQIAAALLLSVVFNSIQLYVQKRLFEQTIALYLSPKLVAKFASDRKFMEEFLQPGALKQELTILFSDIANFTSISERMDSDDLARSMNEYFQGAIANCIHPTDGTVVKYIGDAIFAFWNAPDLQEDHRLRACQAALLFRNQPVLRMNGQPLITRIGLHTGEANVGNFGSTGRFDYTALGENINLAARMEGLNKFLGTIVLATGDAFHPVADSIVARCCGRFRLKGFERTVEVFELVALTGQAEDSRAWREAFAEALRLFQQRAFVPASPAFQRVLELHPDDGPARFYLAKLEDLRAHPPAEGWAGEVELKEK